MTLITTAEAAAFLEVSKVAVHKMEKSGRLKVVSTRPHRGGYVRLFDLAEVKKVKKARKSK